MTIDPASVLRFLPVGLNVRDKECLVVGGGEVGTHKALTLARAGARVTVVSPSVSGELVEHIKGGGVRWVKGPFREEHLRGAFFVVAATNDKALNAEVVRLALRHSPLACDASSAERSEVIFGALLQRDNVTVAVFSDGRDPAEAKRMRDRIARHLGERSEAKPPPSPP